MIKYWKNTKIYRHNTYTLWFLFQAEFKQFMKLMHEMSNFAIFSFIYIYIIYINIYIYLCYIYCIYITIYYIGSEDSISVILINMWHIRCNIALMVDIVNQYINDNIQFLAWTVVLLQSLVCRSLLK